MNCKDVQGLLVAYIDSVLDPETNIDVQTHLKTCQICWREENLLTSTWNALGALPAVQPSPHFQARFWERVRQEEADSNKWWAVFLPKQLVPAAAGFLVIWTLGVASGLFFMGGRTSPSAPFQEAASLFTSPLPSNSIEQIYL